MKQKTILKLENEFQSAIHELGMLGYSLNASELQGDTVLMGAHLTMRYPEKMYLTVPVRKALIRLVSRYYRKPIKVHDHKMTTTILSWVNHNDPNHRVHEIVFVFEKGLANDRLREE
jgi:hypothetical protein